MLVGGMIDIANSVLHASFGYLHVPSHINVCSWNNNIVRYKPVNSYYYLAYCVFCSRILIDTGSGGSSEYVAHLKEVVSNNESSIQDSCHTLAPRSCWRNPWCSQVHRKSKYAIWDQLSVKSKHPIISTALMSITCNLPSLNAAYCWSISGNCYDFLLPSIMKADRSGKRSSL